MIDGESTYSELKKWFIDNMDSLPKSLDGKDKYYLDVKRLANVFIERIDLEFERHGKVKIKRSKAAIIDKQSLFELYRDLEVKENWNKPQPTLEELKKVD